MCGCVRVSVPCVCGAWCCTGRVHCVVVVVGVVGVVVVVVVVVVCVGCLCVCGCLWGCVVSVRVCVCGCVWLCVVVCVCVW